jgi:hypothetical protein
MSSVLMRNVSPHFLTCRSIIGASDKDCVAQPPQFQKNHPLTKQKQLPAALRHKCGRTRRLFLSDQGEGQAMSTQLNGSRYETESVIPFAPNSKNVPVNELDKAGQTILQLLHRAADVAEDNSRHALEMAQKLSHQLRAAEDRIAELEAEAETYRERAERAEQWLHKVYAEIEDRFLRQSEDRRRTNGVPTRATGH